MQRSQTCRLASRVERRTSRNCYRVGRKAGEVLPIPQPRGINSLNMHAVEGDGRRPDCRMMRSGKAEDAMCAAGMVVIAGRQFWRVPGIVQTKLETRRVIANICTKVGAANCDQQALRGDRICDNDASSGRKNRLDLTFSVNTPRMPTSIRQQPHFISLRQSRLYTTLSTQKCRPAGAINVWCSSKATLSTA
jgi:hypothetical protein